MYTLGIDLHKNFAQWCLLNFEGKVLWQKKIPADLETARIKASELPKPCQAVLEPTGSFALYADTLKKEGVDTHLAHPLQVKLIAESKIKNDKVDAEILAQLLRTNFLPKAYLPNEEIRELRSLLTLRSQIINTRTRAKNRMRMLLNSWDVKTDISNLFGNKGLNFLAGLDLSIPKQIQRDQLIRTVGTANSQILFIDSYLSEIAEKDDDIVRMKTIPGIGNISALYIKAYVGDFSRFSNASKLACYAGLVPATRQSGEKTRMGKITRLGPGALRGVLVQAAASVRPKAGKLYTFYKYKAGKIGTSKARILLAKKMLTIAYRVVTDKTVYEENYIKEMGKTRCHCLA